ncbi:MAG: hypothetical protein Rhims3KO_14680 [Hyphomicrobiales bacterium]
MKMQRCGKNGRGCIARLRFDQNTVRRDCIKRHMLTHKKSVGRTSNDYWSSEANPRHAPNRRREEAFFA